MNQLTVEGKLLGYTFCDLLEPVRDPWVLITYVTALEWAQLKYCANLIVVHDVYNRDKLTILQKVMLLVAFQDLLEPGCNITHERRHGCLNLTCSRRIIDQSMLDQSPCTRSQHANIPIQQFFVHISRNKSLHTACLTD